ncbi:PREDICTED: leucine-rich repeat-containing protein 15-like [Branchiostoma belcheri]|uniref:Leucine-rich repeat-containing protein 15-like n=1 Tax=Branchiostoma belcheri TaxID=7741 RepID=A0A6P4ZKB2_BRABE|nr:PREDICTED: leucine-rich repeat-containing protein 15-like [Branchiostoma belcheri]
MPRLSELSLRKNLLRSFPWRSLRNASHLLEISLSNNRLTNVDITEDSAPRNLRKLSVASNNLQFITPFPNLPCLTHLVLFDNKLRDFPWESLLNLPRLADLILSSNSLARVGPGGILNRLKHLEIVDLRGNNLTRLPEASLRTDRSIQLRLAGNPIPTELE